MLNDYVSKYLRLCPQSGKVPIIKNWLSSNLSLEELNKYKNTHNFGWILESSDLVIDVDVKNGGSLKALATQFDLTPTVITQSGGYHIYLTKPPSVLIRREIPEFVGVEFLSKGSLVQIAGSENGAYRWYNRGFEQKKAPEGLLALIEKKINEKKTDYEPASEEDIINAINQINPSIGYNDWIRVGMALHDWDANRGLEIWESWSMNGSNYKSGETLIHWRSFGKGRGVSIGTLFHLADYKRKSTKKSSNSITKEENISNSDNNDNSKSVNSVNWWDKWVYVNSHKGFVDIETFLVHKKESFEAENSQYVEKTTACTFVFKNALVRKADLMLYLPEKPHGLVFLDGTRVLNSFNKKSLTRAASEYSEEGLKSIEKIKNHIYFLCNNEENGEILLQWLAHNIQYPGRKLRWAPLIQSIQGIGKSFIGCLLKSMLGERNVGVIRSDQVSSPFNGWATGVCVNILEELKIKGHNRFEASNAIKDLITDDTIQINKKGVDQFCTRNCTNYICFTNHKDALPIEASDRRWWVIFNQARSVQEIESIVNQKYDVYFKDLYFNLEIHKAEIKKYFDEYQITDSFKSLIKAPGSRFKDSMIRAEEALIEGFQEIQDLLEEGGVGFNSKIVCINDLLKALRKKDEYFANFNIKSCCRILIQLDFEVYKKQLMYAGTRKRVWVRGDVTDEEIKQLTFVKI